MSETEKKPRGRPRYAATDKERAQVRSLAAMGLSHTDIGLVLQMSEKTMRLHFRHELDVGVVEANAKVAQSLFRQATDATKPNVVAAIFWLKCRANWIEPTAERRLRPYADETPGKKDMATRAARTAQEGTEWGELLRAPGIAPLQ